MLKLEIIGAASSKATEELLLLEGLQCTVEESEKYRDPLTIIASIVAILGGTFAAAEQLYQWYQRWKSSQSQDKKGVDRIVIVSSKGDVILLDTASLEDLRKLLESEFSQ